MPKDDTGSYRVKTFKQFIEDLTEILDKVHPIDYKGNPTDDPDSHKEVMKDLQSLYIDLYDIDHKIPMFDEIDAINLVKLKLQTIESNSYYEEEGERMAREAFGHDES